ncbi:TPA: hypothetical protein ACIYQ4_001902 [Escherichia coli]
MIYLLEDDSFIEVDDWVKISNRPNYIENLVVQDRKLEQIIGYYELPEKVKCGLSNCHTPHFKGYVVVTDNGTETNIGHTCGTKYFDVQFDTMSSEFLSALEVAKAKIFISHNKKNVFEFWQKVNSLAVGPKNVNWAIDLYRKINSSEIIGTAAYRALRQMQATGNGNVTTTRPPTAKEIELAQTAGQPAPQSVDVIVGFITNIEFLSPDNDLVELYEYKLRGSVQKLQDADPEKLSRTQLKTIVSGIVSLETNINKAKKIIETARVFFTKENLEQLVISLEDNRNISTADVNRYKDFIGNL